MILFSVPSLDPAGGFEEYQQGHVAFYIVQLECNRQTSLFITN